MYTQEVQPSEKSSIEEKVKALRSTLVSRNVTVGGHRTSVRLEPDMWSALADICRREHSSLHDISTAVARYKDTNTSLTAAIRVFVMAYYRAASTEDGHSKAGHGYGLSVLAANMSTNRPVTTQVTPGAVTIPMQQRQSTPVAFNMNIRAGNLR